MTSEVDPRGYLVRTQAIVYAGKRLLKKLNNKEGSHESIVRSLEQAFRQYEDDGAHFQAFMFSKLEGTAEDERTIRTGLTENILASVLTDLQVANVLIAAGGVTGEEGVRLESTNLDKALRELENTTQVIEKSMRPSPILGFEACRFGFITEGAPERVQSVDLGSSVDRFHAQCDETLMVLVTEANKAVKGIFKALSKIDNAEIVTTLSSLGNHFEALPKVGHLLRSGIEKICASVNALVDLLGTEPLTLIKEKLKDLLDKMKDGEYISQTLEWTFGVKETKSYVTEMIGITGLELKALDQASGALSQLSDGFRNYMSIAQGLTSTVTLSVGILSVTPLAGPPLTLFFASVYLLIVAAVVLLGMDYADSGKLLQRVRGVRGIVQDVRPARN